MSVCKNVKTFSRAHEHIADFFSCLPLCSSSPPSAVTQYYQVVSVWLLHKCPAPWRHPGRRRDTGRLLIFALLAIGSARFGKTTSASAPSPGAATIPGRGIFSSWLNHLESVGKKHAEGFRGPGPHRRGRREAGSGPGRFLSWTFAPAVP
jgi:hypothetical protein